MYINNNNKKDSIVNISLANNSSAIIGMHYQWKQDQVPLKSYCLLFVLSR